MLNVPAVPKKSISVEKFNEIWAFFDNSPFLYLYKCEQDFFKSLMGGDGDACKCQLSHLYTVFNDIPDLLKEKKNDYWIALLGQCEDVPEVNDTLIAMVKETLVSFLGIQLEPVTTGKTPTLQIPEALDEPSVPPDVETEQDLSALGAAAPPLDQQEGNISMECMPPEEELLEAFSHLSHESVQGEELSPWKPVDRTKRKGRRERATDTVTRSLKKSTKHNVQRADKGDTSAGSVSRHSRRNSVDIVTGFQSIARSADSAHVCYRGPSNFYTCESRALEVNETAASDFLTIFYVYELRAENLCGWLGASQPVFRHYSKKRAYLEKGKEDLEFGTVKNCRGYVETFKTHPLRGVHRANIALFSVVLKSFSSRESIVYHAGRVCDEVRKYLDTEAAQREGEGVRDFYQDIVDWCRHNQKNLQAATLQKMIDIFNQSLASLNKPGQVS